MMRSIGVRRGWLAAALFVFALMWGTTIQAAAPTSWKDTGFSIDAGGMTLTKLLDEFGRVYGVRISISAKDALVKGRLKADTGAEFLDRLSLTYKFRWFVYNDTLYIVPRDDNTSVRLEVGEDAVQDAKSVLVGLGLFDSRFGWGELPDEGIVMVSGPREYVKLVRDILLPDEKKVELKGKHIMVFRLKYASATDRVINARGRTETIPGIKTILSNLLLSSPAGTSSESQSGKLSDVNQKIDLDSRKRSRTTKIEKGDAREVPTSPFMSNNNRAQGESEVENVGSSKNSSKSKSASGESRPRIDADPSLNAIIIYDQLSKREMYQSLIEELDIQPQQIEIEALIVDIDRSKLSEMGVEWSARSGNVSATMNSTQADSQGVDLPLPGATLLISNAGRFYARLKALEGSGEARVLATPTILTLDNVAAVLDLSQTKYISLVGERVADLADVTAGTMLRVIPRIVQDGNITRVRLEVDIEDGTLGDVAGSNVTRSTISTQAIIDLHQTLMIGGYRSESTATNKQKVPLLGDLPLVGSLFRNQTASSSTRERLFLITPRLSGTLGIASAPSVSKAAKVARKVISDERRMEVIPPSENAPVIEAGSKISPAGATPGGATPDAVNTTNAANAGGAPGRQTTAGVAADKPPLIVEASSKISTPSSASTSATASGSPTNGTISAAASTSNTTVAAMSKANGSASAANTANATNGVATTSRQVTASVPSDKPPVAASVRTAGANERNAAETGGRVMTPAPKPVAEPAAVAASIQAQDADLFKAVDLAAMAAPSKPAKRKCARPKGTPLMPVSMERF